MCTCANGCVLLLRHASLFCGHCSIQCSQLIPYLSEQLRGRTVILQRRRFGGPNGCRLRRNHVRGNIQVRNTIAALDRPDRTLKLQRLLQPGLRTITQQKGEGASAHIVNNNHRDAVPGSARASLHLPLVSRSAQSYHSE